MSSAVGVSLITALGPDLQETLAMAAEGKPPVIWLQGASCTGCSISLLNSVDPAIEKVLLDVISLKYHPNISAGSGHLVAEIMDDLATNYKDQFILVIEGAIPVNNEGAYCTIAEKGGKEITMLHVWMSLEKRLRRLLPPDSARHTEVFPVQPPIPPELLESIKLLTLKR
jgi:hydrogenase small subunit